MFPEILWYHWCLLHKSSPGNELLYNIRLHLLHNYKGFKYYYQNKWAIGICEITDNFAARILKIPL